MAANYYDQAVTLVNRSRYDLAERQLRQALGQNPLHAASYALLAVCLAQLEREREALAAADEALRLDPNLAFAHYARARAGPCAQLRRAIKDAQEAIRIDPTLPNQYSLLAAIYSDLGDYKRSLAEAERGLQLKPTHTECASLQALALWRLGRKREAEAAISTALSSDPNNDFAHTAQGWRLFQQHKRRAARQHFLEALRVNPENRWARDGLSTVKWAVFTDRFSLVWTLVAAVLLAAVPVMLNAEMLVVVTLVVPAVLVALGVGLLVLRDRLRDPPTIHTTTPPTRQPG